MATQPEGGLDGTAAMRTLIVILAAVALAACESRPVDSPTLRAVDPGERDSAIALLQRVGTETIDRAFAELSRQPHTLHERLHQFDESGRINAYRRRTVAVDPPDVTTVTSESEGTFDFGAFGRFVSFDDLDRLPQNPVPFILAEDPPFLTPQGRELYHFAFDPDTTVHYVRLTSVTVTARPGDGDDQPLRRARMLIDPATEQIVSLRIERHSSNVLFGETSTLEISLSPSRQLTWLPARTNYRVALRAALTATRRFQLERDYELPGAPRSELAARDPR